MLCLGDDLSDEEKLLTDDAILGLNVHKSRALCGKCKYRVRGAGRLSDTMLAVVKTLSKSGKKGDMSARLLSWFYHFRQELACGPVAREYEMTGGNMSVHEDIRLLEILVDKKYHKLILAIYEKSDLATLDAADASPLGDTWKYVIAPLFNNKVKYRPEQRDPDCEIMGKWDPNHESIRRRPADVLTTRYAVLRSAFTRVHNNYKKSGNNDPSNLALFCNKLKSDMDKIVWFMLKALWIDAGDDSFAQRSLRRLPGEAPFDTIDPASVGASLTNSNAQQDGWGGDSVRTRSGAATPTQTSLILDHMSAMEERMEERMDQRMDRGAAAVATIAANNVLELRTTMLIIRDAEAKRDSCAIDVRSAQTATAKKKAKLIAKYKAAARTVSVYSRKLADLENNDTYEEEKDDASFLVEDIDSSSDDYD